MGKYRNLALNLAIFALNMVATKLITFVLIPLYTYFLSAGEYGITDMSLTVITLATPLVTLSIADAALRFIIEDGAHASEYVAIGVCVTLGSVVLVGMLSPVLDLPVFGGLGAYKAFFILAYASNAVFNFCGELARGLNHVKLIPVCAVTSSLVTAGLAFPLIGLVHLGVVGYFISVITGPLVGASVYVVLGRYPSIIVRGFRALRSGGERGLSVSAAFRRMLTYSLPLIPNALFWWIGTSINRFFITGMLGIAASGLFAAASKISNMLNMLYTVFQQAWQLSAFQESKDERIAAFFSTVFSALLAVMGVGAAALSCFAPLIASVLLQKEFYTAWTLIPVSLLAFYFNALNAFVGTVFTANMKTRSLMTTTTAGSLLCMLFTWLLIPPFGLVGASTAMVVGNAAVFLLRVRSARRVIRFDMAWPRLVLTSVLLCGQAAVVYLQLPGWPAASAGVLAVLAVVHIACNRRLAVTALQAVRARRLERK